MEVCLRQYSLKVCSVTILWRSVSSVFSGGLSPSVFSEGLFCHYPLEVCLRQYSLEVCLVSILWRSVSVTTFMEVCALVATSLRSSQLVYSTHHYRSAVLTTSVVLVTTFL